MNILKPWQKFDPREQMNDEFCAYHMPHYVSYSCVVNSPEFFDTRVTIMVMDSPACGFPPVVVVQFAEQYNGQYDSFVYGTDHEWSYDDSELRDFVKSKVEEVLQKDFTY